MCSYGFRYPIHSFSGVGLVQSLAVACRAEISDSSAYSALTTNLLGLPSFMFTLTIFAHMLFKCPLKESWKRMSLKNRVGEPLDLLL